MTPALQGIGIGGKYDLDNGGSWFGCYTFVSQELESIDTDFDVLRVGYRHKVSEPLELNANLISTKFNDSSDSKSGYQLGMVYAVSKSVQVTADYETIDENENLSVGTRFEF